MTIRKSKKLTPIVFSALIATAVVTSNDISYASQGEELSTIGGVVVDNLSEKEITELVTKSIAKWTSTPVTLKDKDTNLEIDSNKILFDVNGTVAQYTQLTKKAWYQLWKQKPIVNLPVIINPSKEILTSLENNTTWDKEVIYQNIIAQASILGDHKISAVKIDQSKYENERVGLLIKELASDNPDLNKLADKFNNTIINTDTYFSILNILGEEIYEYRTETLNMLSSAIYEMVLSTPLKIKERNYLKETLENVKPGLEAVIDKSNNMDLQLVNKTEYPCKLKVSVNDNKLKVELYSDKKQEQVSVETKEYNIAPKNIYRYSKDLALWEKKVIQAGKVGLSVEVYRRTGVGPTTNIERVSKDYYPPQNRIILISINQKDKTEEADSKGLEMDLNGDMLPDIAEEPKQSEVGEPTTETDKGGNEVVVESEIEINETEE